MTSLFTNPIDLFGRSKPPLSFFNVGQQLPQFLIENYLTKNQLIRLFRQNTYSEITHELYYHMGMFFKKRYIASRKRLSSFRREFIPRKVDIGQSSFGKFSVFAEEEDLQIETILSPELLEKAREIYEESLEMKKQWQRIFALIRGKSEDAKYFREGVSDFAKRIAQGRYFYDGLEPNQQLSNQEIFDEWRDS